MPLTNTEVDAAVPVAGIPNRTLVNAALKELIADIAAVGGGGGGGGATNLAYDSATRTVSSDTGTDAILPLFNATIAGLVPLSGGGTTNFLRADGTWAAPAGGGGGTWGSITGTLSSQTDLNAALRIDAPFYTANAMGALAIDVTKAVNTKSINANSTFTFSGTPANANTYFALVLTNSGGTDVVVTIPSSYSELQQSTITSFTLPGNAVIEMVWRYNGSIYILKGEPTRNLFETTLTFIGTTTARDYPIILKNSKPLVITAVVSKCASGTCTATVKIDGVALGGTANAVSSTEQEQAHTTTNSAGSATDVIVTTTAGAVDMQLSIKGYYV